jgi:hypothetical protein
MVKTLVQRWVLAALALLVVVVAPEATRAGLLLSMPSDVSTGVLLAWEPGTTEGFSFTVGPSALSVTRLGILDAQFKTNGTGLFEAHQVGLWNTQGVLLGSTTVPGGTTAPLLDGFRFADLSSAVLLNPGQTYVLGAQYPTDLLSDPNPDMALVESSAQMAALMTGATFVQGQRTGQGVNFFSFPTETGTSGYVGPNMEFIEVPEPSTLVLGLLGLTGLGSFAHLRRRLPDRPTILLQRSSFAESNGEAELVLSAQAVWCPVMS